MALEVEGQVNGKASKLASKAFKREFERAFAKIPNLSLGEGGGRLRILAHNKGDVGEAAKKGAASGFTMGIMGVEVTDHYEFTFTYTPAAGSTFSRSYNHALHSIIGATKSPPEGITAMSLPEAFKIVIDDAAKTFIRDLVKSGKL